MDYAAWTAGGEDVGSVVADPLITSNVTFALDPASPARARGFVPIDVASIGPRPAVVGAPGSGRLRKSGVKGGGSRGTREALAALRSLGLVRG